MMTFEKKNSTGMKPGAMDEAALDGITSGKGSGQGIVDFFAWIACGFSHDYEDTGKTKVVMDGPVPTRFKQVRCRECGHKTWKRVGIA